MCVCDQLLIIHRKSHTDSQLEEDERSKRPAPSTHAEELGGILYQPKTRETRQSYEVLLNFILHCIGDQVCLSVCVYLFVSVCVCACVCPYMCIYVCGNICVCVCLSVLCMCMLCLCVVYVCLLCLHMCMCICLSVCACVYL